MVKALLVAAAVVAGCRGTDSGDSPLQSSGGAGSASTTSSAQTSSNTPTSTARVVVPCAPVDLAIDRSALATHLKRLETIAAEHGGHRAARSPGYAASVAYVTKTLVDAGLSVVIQRFDLPVFRMLGPGTLALTTPKPRQFRAAMNLRRPAASHGAEHTALRGSPPGDVTAEVAAVELAMGAAETTSGCEPGDFTSSVAGKIALMVRGGCTFGTKVRNAEKAGAVAALVVNQGDKPDRKGLMAGDLIDERADHGVTIPATFATAAVGVELAALLAAGPVALHLVVQTELRRGESENVLVDVPGASDEVVMLGAHLDSVEAGPGINDNGSGSAAILEMARHFGACTPARTLRFAFWGAEELGLLGSNAYVARLDDAEKKRIRVYLNLDMIGSSNHVYMLADGDGSATKKPGPGSSAEVERFFHADFASAAVPLVEVPYHFRSDYQAFHRAGIGVGDLGTGIDARKTAAQAARFGGIAGRLLDPCYHQKCDGVGNVNAAVLEIVTRSVARALQHFGVEGRGLAPPPAPAPAGSGGG